MQSVERRLDALHEIESAGRNAVEREDRADEQENRGARYNGQPDEYTHPPDWPLQRAGRRAEIASQCRQFAGDLSQAGFRKPLANALFQLGCRFDDLFRVEPAIMRWTRAYAGRTHLR